MADSNSRARGVSEVGSLRSSDAAAASNVRETPTSSKGARHLQQKTPYGTRLTVPRERERERAAHQQPPLPLLRPLGIAGAARHHASPAPPVCPSRARASSSGCGDDEGGQGRQEEKKTSLPPWASGAAMEAPGAREAEARGRGRHASPAVRFTSPQDVPEDTLGGRLARARVRAGQSSEFSLHTEAPWGSRHEQASKARPQRAERDRQRERERETRPQQASPNALRRADGGAVQGGMMREQQARSGKTTGTGQPRAGLSGAGSGAKIDHRGGGRVGARGVGGGRPAWAASILAVRRGTPPSSDVEASSAQGTICTSIHARATTHARALTHTMAVGEY